MLPVSSEDIDLNPSDTPVGTALLRLVASVVAVCGIAQIVNMLARP